MTQPKGRPAIEPKDRRVNFTVSTAPETKDWLDQQDVSRGDAIDQLVKFWHGCQTKKLKKARRSEEK